MATKKQAEEPVKTPAKQEQGTVVQAQQDNAALAMMAEETETGLEGMGSDDFAIPIVDLLQKMSPQVDEDRGEYVEGAKAGMIFNTSTEEVMDGKKGVRFIPCAYQRKMVRWRDRDDGGGLVAVYDPDDAPYQDAERRDDGKWWFDDNTYLSDTRYWYGLLLPDGLPEDGSYPERVQEVVVPFKSTQIKKSRSWVNRIKDVRIPGTSKMAPMFGQAWLLQSVTEQKDNNTFSGWKIGEVKLVANQELFLRAKELRKLVNQGQAQADQAQAAAKTGDQDAGAKPGKGGSQDDEEIPF